MKRKAREALLAYLFLVPSFLILGTFVFWPVGFSFVLSFFRWDFKNMKNPVFAGIENYAEIFRFQSPPSHSFIYSLIETLIVICVCFSIVLSIYNVKRRRYLSTAVFLASIFCIWVANKHLIFSLLAVVLIVLDYLLLKNNKILSKHGISVGFTTIVLIILWIFLDKRIYTVVDFFFESRDKNLFIKAIYNTLYYVVLSVPTTIFIALVIALLLNSNIKLRAFFRTAYFIPFVTSAVAISLVWRWIFDDAYGLLNYLLSFLNISKIAWLKDERWTIPTIAIVSIWKTVGYDAVI
ncbi:MAG TPA: sugar ABC transporter permease, partial [Pseudothermotoga sp.]